MVSRTATEPRPRPRPDHGLKKHGSVFNLVESGFFLPASVVSPTATVTATATEPRPRQQPNRDRDRDHGRNRNRNHTVTERAQDRPKNHLHGLKKHGSAFNLVESVLFLTASVVSRTGTATSPPFPFIGSRNLRKSRRFLGPIITFIWKSPTRVKKTRIRV